MSNLSLKVRQEKIKFVTKWNGDMDTLLNGDVLFSYPLETDNKVDTEIFTYDTKNKCWLKLYHDNIFYWEKTNNSPSLGSEVSNIECIYFSSENWSIKEDENIQFQFWMGRPDCALLLEGWNDNNGSHFMDNYESVENNVFRSGWNVVENPNDLIIDIYYSSQPLKDVSVLGNQNDEWEVVTSDTSDGEAYDGDKEDCWTEDPSYDDWYEKRQDPFNEKWYTKQEFKNYYGGLIEWNYMEPHKVLKRKKLDQWIHDNIDYMRDSAINHVLDKLFDTFN